MQTPPQCICLPPHYPQVTEQAHVVPECWSGAAPNLSVHPGPPFLFSRPHARNLFYFRLQQLTDGGMAGHCSTE